MKFTVPVMLVIAIAGFVILAGLAATEAQSYTPLPTGNITGISGPTMCSSDYASGASCYTATVNCPNTDALGFTFGKVSVSSNRGTIVLFNGGAGDMTAGGTDFANDYVSDGYQVVQVVWDSPWETSGVLINYGSVQAYSIKYAGCRPATVLNFIYQNIFPKGQTTGAGMCAQGTSAGSAAIGYALAEYGSYAYLDNVELLSGPVLSDIANGCDPSTAKVDVCAGQPYCQTGVPPQGGWWDKPQYIEGYRGGIDTWSGIPSACNETGFASGDDVAWKQMSIVDGLTDSTFSYPQTKVAGWLCSDTSTDCGGSGQPACQNNSAAEGQYFYQQISSAASLNVYRINQCYQQEGVSDGFLPPPKEGESGYNAIKGDMEANCNH